MYSGHGQNAVQGSQGGVAGDILGIDTIVSQGLGQGHRDGGGQFLADSHEQVVAVWRIMAYLRAMLI